MASRPLPDNERNESYVYEILGNGENEAFFLKNDNSKVFPIFICF